WLRLVESGRAGAIIPEVLFYYRRRAESMSRVMLDARAYRRPLDVLLAKHDAAYREHLTDVIVAKEREALHLGREVADLERDRLTTLEPALRRAREELAAAARKAEQVRRRKAEEEELQRLRVARDELQRETVTLRSEVAALRESLSWRLSAPLRRIYDIFGGRGR
ncbi:MAG: hypothetical protein ABI603_14550, partial [Acidobacteriota bacterium]